LDPGDRRKSPPSNRRRRVIGDDRIEQAAAESVAYVQADLFNWQPERNFDAVLFFFWISHVPAGRIDAFLRSIATMLNVGGWVFFLDSRRESTSTANDHVLPGDGEEVMIRRLDDGREFSIVKNFWDPRRLEEKCDEAGLEVTVSETGRYFQYGVGRRR
jgi:2-polyprenyl-3-methyl-5-hydroxy-6-metoxy-1,4-benzoquinol methylase